jgi:large subunit ribosomal protein L29
MKAKDLRDRATEDLAELRDVMRRELFQNRMKNVTNQLEDTSLLRKARRDIARIETILESRTQSESAASSEAEGSQS